MDRNGRPQLLREANKSWRRYGIAHCSLATGKCTLCSNLSTLFLQATGRLRKNALYFKINYLVVILTITAVTMALYPTSLIVLGCLALAWLYLFVV